MLEGRLLAIGFKDAGVIADCPRCGKVCRLIDLGACLIRVEEVGRTAENGGEVLFVVHDQESCRTGETPTAGELVYPIAGRRFHGRS